MFKNFGAKLIIIGKAIIPPLFFDQRAVLFD